MQTNRRDFLQLLAGSTVSTIPTAAVAVQPGKVAKAIEAHTEATARHDEACLVEDALYDTIAPREQRIYIRPSMGFCGSIREQVTDDSEIVDAFDSMTVWYDRLDDDLRALMPPRSVLVAKLEAEKEAKREELRALYRVQKAKEDAAGFTAAVEAETAAHKAKQAAFHALLATTPTDLEEARLKASYLASYMQQHTEGGELITKILLTLI